MDKFLIKTKDKQQEKSTPLANDKGVAVDRTSMAANPNGGNPTEMIVDDSESSGSSVDSPDGEGREKEKRKYKKPRLSISTERAQKRACSPSRCLDKLQPHKDCQSVKLSTQGLQTDDSIADSVAQSNSDNESAQNIAAKKNKSYPQKFKAEWKSKYPWLETRVQSNQLTSFCQLCQKSILGGKSHLDRHEKTSTHVSNYKKAENTVAMENYLDREQFEKAKTRDRLVKAAEMKLTMFLHEHNLPFLVMDHLPKLISAVCTDSEIAKALKCGRTKTKGLTECIAAEQITQISQKLKESVYSIIIDETTDVGTEKSLAMVKVTSCTAEALFNAVTNHLKDLGIPIANMIGYAADNASVMMGNISGVQARFKEILPNLFVLGCVCHSIHLCSSAAAHQLPRSVEGLVRGIYNYFAHSSKRLEKLREFQVFVDLKPHKLLHPSQTRWLSVRAAVDRVLENWEALTPFFTNEYYEDNLLASQTILSQLKCPAFKIYFTFLSYILDLVNCLNLEFQAEKPKLHLLLSRVRNLYRNILRNYIRKDHLDSVSLRKVEPSNPRTFIKLEEIYFGAKTELLMQNENIDPKEIHDFSTRSLAFYTTLSEQIRKRFDFENPTLMFVSHFDPRTALLGEVPNISTEASKLFPQLVDDVEKLNTEWRLLPDLAELQAYKDYSFEEFWVKIFGMVNDLNDMKFPNLTKLVKVIHCLPHSSAAAERVFSQLNLMKSKTRNRLNVSTCDVILHAKQLLGKDFCHNWEPNSALLNRKPQYT